MKKAFSLIEILIASTIFAVIMLIVTSTFSWASLYNVRISETRDTSLDARKITEMISKDLRLANGGITIKENNGSNKQEVGEFSVYICSMPDECALERELVSDQKLDDLDKPNNYGNALLIIQKDQKKAVFYREVKGKYTFTRQEADLNDGTVINISNLIKYDTSNTEQVINSNNVDVIAKFAGFTPTTKSAERNAQPFIKMKLIFQTDDYNNQPPMYRSSLEVNTSVTSRNYNLDTKL